MVAEVFSAMIQGIEGQIVKIQVDISNGLPNFNMIGYLSNEVKESKERVRTALNNIGVLLPPKRISVNFAPADFRKCGTSFDIGVAAAILLAMDFVPETYIKDTLFVGELSLNGQICPISGVLPIVVAASKRGIKRCIVAQENVAEAAFVEPRCCPPAPARKAPAWRRRTPPDGSAPRTPGTSGGGYHRRRAGGSRTPPGSPSGPGRRYTWPAPAAGSHGSRPQKGQSPPGSSPAAWWAGNPAPGRR